MRGLKSFVKRALVKTGSLELAARFRVPRAAILMYHSVRADPKLGADWIGPGITHSTRVFAHQMELVGRRFSPVTLDHILLFLIAQKQLPRRAVAITFDDGYLDNLEEAATVLNRLGIPAAFYLTTGLIGQADAPWFCRVRHAFMKTKRNEWPSSGHQRNWELVAPASRDAALSAAYDLCSRLTKKDQQQAVYAIELELGVEPVLPESRLMMNWDEIRTLRRSGHIVGSHTLTHPNTAHVSQEDALRAEIFESKRQLESYLREPVVHFSYPHPALRPQWNAKTLAMTREAGYATAVTTNPGPIRAHSNPLLLTRINAGSTEDEFLWNLERTFAET
ncbi:MAG: hypothetical protein DMG89_06715 [Acidobacteria bacterium]|nr:MAG: hypothetical protein DMG89_06715 [Acidobacteriota bacterium]